MKLTITYLDGSTLDVDSRGIDQIEWERHFGVPFMDVWQQGRGVFTEHIWFLCWVTARRDNPTLPDFDEWAATVESAGLAKAEEPADPLDQTASPGN